MPLVNNDLGTDPGEGPGFDVYLVKYQQAPFYKENACHPGIRY